MQPRLMDGAEAHEKKCVAVMRPNVAGRFHPVKSVQAEKSVFCSLGGEKSVREEFLG
jgi:hypothetical protein